MKKYKIARTEVFERFMHVVLPQKDSPVRRVQAVGENGRVITAKCLPEIYSAVLGERIEKEKNKNASFTLGLRKLSKVRFRAHYDESDTIVALDILPNRMFTSGVAPTAAGDAARKGFTVHWMDDLCGFDVWTENREGERIRIGYAGMSEKQLYDLLDEIRGFVRGSKRKATLLEHAVEKLDGGTFLIKPVREVRYVT